MFVLGDYGYPLIKAWWLEHQISNLNIENEMLKRDEARVKIIYLLEVGARYGIRRILTQAITPGKAYEGLANYLEQGVFNKESVSQAQLSDEVVQEIRNFINELRKRSNAPDSTRAITTEDRADIWDYFHGELLDLIKLIPTPLVEDKPVPPIVPDTFRMAETRNPLAGILLYERETADSI
jgi:hypothetical protein